MGVTRRALPLPTAQRRQAIVEAVIPLLADRGAAATSRELAAAAGVSEGTVFKVFTDKSELFAAVVDHVRDTSRYEAALDAVNERSTGDFIATLVEMVTVMQKRTLNVWNLLSKLPHSPQHRPMVSATGLVAMFERFNAEHRLDPDEAARTLRGVTLALSHPQLVPEPYPAERIVDLFLNGASR